MKSKKTKEALEKLVELKKQGYRAEDIAAALGISVPTYYKWSNSITINASKKIKVETEFVQDFVTTQFHESVIEEPLFPDGKEATMYFIPTHTKMGAFSIEKHTLEGQTVITKYNTQIEAFRLEKQKLNKQVLRVAERFYQTNNGRNLEEKYKDYMKKYELFTDKEHQKKISRLQTVDLSDFLQERHFAYRYHSFCNFNQFVILDFEHIEALKKEIDQFIEEVLDEEVEVPTLATTEPILEQPKFPKVKQFQIYWYPFQGWDNTMLGKHPCVVVSSDERINNPLNSAIVLPMTSKERRNQYSENIPCTFNKKGSILGAQMLTVSQEKLEPSGRTLPESEKVAVQLTILKNLGLDETTLASQIRNLLEMKRELLAQIEELDAIKNRMMEEKIDQVLGENQSEKTKKIGK